MAALAAAGALPPSVARAEPQVETVARGLVHPWSVAFLPDGGFLVTERPGRLRRLEASGRLQAPLEGLPAVSAGGQCGLLDVLVPPDHAQSGRIYLSLSEAGPTETGEAGNGVVVYVARLQGQRLTDLRRLFEQQPKVDSKLHCGGRLALGRDGHLWLTLGDRFQRKDDAPRLDNHLGKIVRITTDGEVPRDNPLLGRASARPEIWSWGHRNVQGAAVHPQTGELWTTEHGPQGGDELNRTLPGRHYGWPEITYGRNYGSGTRIGEGAKRDDVQSPVWHWAPTSIAPSGLTFVSSPRYPSWQGDLLLGALRGEALVRLQLRDQQVVREERLLTRLGERIRDVRQAPDGWIYLLTDNADGRLLRLKP
ncbi:PQQ-dependent sugar dehydrogenase [Ideonella livida]|uniref:PQQ-dependent sugar dehydrogenase n=1 Tax=Ideonella livida TaxID=2707176 RepID=UPI001EF31576|nr:PQQ-dependent sugar dehydrogenase [Ideonella livida]